MASAEIRVRVNGDFGRSASALLVPDGNLGRRLLLLRKYQPRCVEAKSGCLGDQILLKLGIQVPAFEPKSKVRFVRPGDDRVLVVLFIKSKITYEP